MKKFVEPELRRIELKLSENIASSDEKDYEGSNVAGTFRTRQKYIGCSEVVIKTLVPADYESIQAVNWETSGIKGCFGWGTTEASAARTFGLR